MERLLNHLSVFPLELAPRILQVAGFLRASPSTTLDNFLYSFYKLLNSILDLTYFVKICL